VRLLVNKSRNIDAPTRISNANPSGSSGTVVDGALVGEGVTAGVAVAGGVGFMVTSGCIGGSGVGVGVISVTVQLQVETSPAAFWNCT